MYRENIIEIINATGGLPGVLFIPKNGGLYDYVIAMLPEIGIETRIKDGTRISDLEIRLARGEDIPKLVEERNTQGQRAYGLTGDDLFDEYLLTTGPVNLIVLNTYDWFDEQAEFLKPALCLMNKTGKVKDIPEKARVAVNSKYEQTARQYLFEALSLKGISIDVNVYNGDTEKWVSDGTNDCCVETVYGGATRKENGLIVIDPVRFSDIVLIGEDPNLLGKMIVADLKQIQEIKVEKEERSPTYRLLQSKKGVRDKLATEASEVFSAIEGNGDLIPEIADLIYAMNLVMVGRDVNPRTLAYELQKRLK